MTKISCAYIAEKTKALESNFVDPDPNGIRIRNTSVSDPDPDSGGLLDPDPGA